MEPPVKLYVKMLQHYPVRSHQVVLLDTYLLCSSACELGEGFPKMLRGWFRVRVSLGKEVAVPGGIHSLL